MLDRVGPAPWTKAQYRRLRAFWAALRPGGAATIRRRLQRGIPADVDFSGDGTTPLHVAAVRGADDVVVVLLEHGADPTRTTERGSTVFDAAAYSGNERVMQVLVDTGAPVSSRTLTSALGRRHFAVARVLVEGGVDVDNHDDRALPAVLQAIQQGADLRLIEALLQRSAVVGIDARTVGAAAVGDRADVLQMLSDRGASLDVVDDEGRHLLTRALLAGADDAASWLRFMGLREQPGYAAAIDAARSDRATRRPGKIVAGNFKGFVGAARVLDDHLVLVVVDVFGRSTEMILDAAQFAFDDVR